MTAHPALDGTSPLRPEVRAGADMLIVRELTGGLYFGRPQGRSTDDGVESVVDTLRYTRPEIERIVEDLAFGLAADRRGRLTSVDKANVLASSRLWREVVDEIAPRYPSVSVEHALVDSTAYLVLTQPTYYDVIVTENLFGDILSDEAAAIAGSLGCSPRPAWARGSLRRAGSASTSPFTAAPRGSPAREWPIRWRQSRRPRSSCAGPSARSRRPMCWTAPAMRPSSTARARATSAAPTARRRSPPSCWPASRSARRCRRDHPVRHHAARRHPGGGHLALVADKLRIARRLDELGVQYIEGGWPGSNPKDEEFFEMREASSSSTPSSRAFGSTRALGQAPRAGPEAAARCWRPSTPRDDHRRQELALPVDEALGATPGREPRDDRRLGALPQAARREVVLRRRALLRRLQGRPGLRARRPARGRRRRREDLVLCDTNGGTLPHEVEADASRSAVRSCPAGRSASTPTTTPSSRSPTRSPRCAPARRHGAGHHQRLRRALRQRQPGHDLGDLQLKLGLSRARRRPADAAAGAVALRRGRQPRARGAAAVRRPQRLRAQGRRPRTARPSSRTRTSTSTRRPSAARRASS